MQLQMRCLIFFGSSVGTSTPFPVSCLWSVNSSRLKLLCPVLLKAKNFSVWGYKPRYYDGKKYTAKELKELFDIPFKIETQDLGPKWADWLDRNECKEFHEWIFQRALDVMEHGEKDHSVDKNGKPLRLVEVLVPDLASSQKLFEC